MGHWSDLPKELRLRILKYTTANIIKDHLRRIPRGDYWGRPGDYNPYLDSDDEIEIPIEGISIDFLTTDCHTDSGDACEYGKPYKHSQLVSLLTVSKDFMTKQDLEIILLYCRLLRWTELPCIPEMNHRFTAQQRRKFNVFWIRSEPIPDPDAISDVDQYAATSMRVDLKGCKGHFPHLRLVNLQLEQHIQADMDVSKDYDGRLRDPRLVQDSLDWLYYKTPSKEIHVSWLYDLVRDATVLERKLELRISFQAKLKDDEKEYFRVAVFSTNDFHVRFAYEGQEMAIKQHHYEHQHRTEILEEAERIVLEGSGTN